MQSLSPLTKAILRPGTPVLIRLGLRRLRMLSPEVTGFGRPRSQNHGARRLGNRAGGPAQRYLQTEKAYMYIFYNCWKPPEPQITRR
jgi:hypothetical protein